jgi:hypothetical protein
MVLLVLQIWLLGFDSSYCVAEVDNIRQSLNQ